MIADYPTSANQDGVSQRGAAALEPAISVRAVGKMYRMYDRPQDRLKHMLMWRFGRPYGREFWALRGVSFEVGRGETLGVIGRNGSGKSTLLQIIAGTLAPNEGQVQVNGRVAALLELGSGFNPEFTGRENVLLNGAILGFSREEMERRFDEIAAFAGIGAFIDQPVKTYSSGMFVRLAFAVQACVDPDILIVDEALSVGDIFFQQKCAQRIQRMRENGTSILLVTHDMAAVARLCQRVALIADGRLIALGPPKPVLEQYTAMMYDQQQPGRHPRSGIHAGSARHDQRPLPLRAVPAHAFRHGDGGMHITSFALHTPEGAPVAQLEAGETLCLTLDITCHEPDLLPNVGFQVQDRFGNMVCGTNTWMLAAPLAAQAGGATFRLTFEIQLMLGSGEYTVSTAVASFDPKPERVYDWIDQLASFVVAPPKLRRVDGIAYCPVTVTSAALDDGYDE